jgi:hypothetical protein
MELSLLGLSRLFSLSVQLAGNELHKKQSDSLRKTQKCNIYIYIYIIEGENEQIIENHQQKLSLRISWA